jgi:hypothetical protein
VLSQRRFSGEDAVTCHSHTVSLHSSPQCGYVSYTKDLNRFVEIGGCFIASAMAECWTGW